MNQRSLEELASWAEKALWTGTDSNCCRGLNRFGKPHPGFWPNDTMLIPAMIKRIQQALEEYERPAFHAFCLASGLLLRNPGPIIKILADFFHPEDVGLPYGHDILSKTRWICLPVPVLDNRKGRILFMLLGGGAPNLLPLSATCTIKNTAFLDTEARQAVHLAACLAGYDHFAFWIPQTSSMPFQITGPSLGLSVYLGLMLLKKGTIAWPDLVCSGSLGPSGIVLPVEGLKYKIAAAQDAGYTGFIFPHENDTCFSEILPNHFDLMPVSDTDSAQVLAECYLSGSGRARVNFYRNRHYIDTVINTLGTVDFSFLRYLENREQFLSRFLRVEIGGPFKQKALLSRLEENLSRYSAEDLNWLLYHLFPCTEVQSLVQTSPTVAWQALGLHIRLANHQGLIREFQKWEKMAQNCLKNMLKEKEVDEEHLLLGLYSIISGFHNQYDFSPNILSNNTPAFAPFICELERRWLLRCQKAPDAVEKLLGAYYGTMAQHYGFCGPSWHKQAEEYICKAIAAFGKGEYDPCKPDWQRIFAYRFFCCLDIGDTKSAHEALKSYLGSDPLSVRYDRLRNRFEHFLLARYLAESGTKDTGYRDWVQQNQFIKNCTKDHPWPLWALNMGRIQNDPGLKKDYWLISLDLCLQNPGPTIRIMGLMPLARLAAEKLAEESFLKPHINKILDDCRNSGVNRAHFAPLWDISWKDIPELVMAHVAKYFPFSYR